MELLEEHFRADGSKSFTHYLNDAKVNVGSKGSSTDITECAQNVESYCMV